MWQRILTGAFVFIVTLAGVLWTSAPVFLGLTSLCFGYAGWEWSRIIGLKKFLGRGLFVLGVAVFGGWFFCEWPVWMIGISAVWWMIATGLVITYPRSAGFWKRSLEAQMVMGILTLVPAWVALNFLRSLPQGVALILALFFLVWSADTGAYLTGRAMGKHLLSPTVSPKKTWEGAIGGLVCAMGTIGGFLWACSIPLQGWVPILLVSAVTVFFSVIGDLSESMLKRHAGVKDSGSCLPGHGGLLDRIDSLTAAAPVFCIGLWLIGAGFTH